MYMNNHHAAPDLCIAIRKSNYDNMGPTNIRLIGLGTSSKPINSALLTHLPYIQSTHGKSHCEIFTRYSLSAKIVKRAVEQSNLSDSIKTHEAPEDLANDPDLELVVCVADVESHYDLLLLAIGTGMSVYTGLPIALNMKQMQELIDSAEKNGIRTVFESQGQAHPAAHLIKKMIAKNKIGKPLSITLIATTGLPLDRPLPVGFKMLAERKAGGNFATIWCSHSKFLIT